MLQDEETPTKVAKMTWAAELPVFIFLACLANPFALIGPYRLAQIVYFCLAWYILSKRYSIGGLYEHLGRPSARILIWVYFGTLVVTGWQAVSDSEPNLLRPARYSVHYYAYGLEEDSDDEGRLSATASHVICKGPYRLVDIPEHDGLNGVPDQVDGAPLEGVSREYFFFWQASGTEKAKNNVSFLGRGFYNLLNELVSYALPKFILICLLLAILSFHRKARTSLRLLVAALSNHRFKPT